MKKIAIIIIIGWLVFSGKIQAQNLFPLLGGQRAGTAAATFLKIDVGASATAMGGAGVALAGDATAMYWNPASAAQVKGNAFTVTHIQWPVEIQYEYLGYLHHLNRWSTVGISLGMLHTEDMEITDEYHPTGTGEYFRFGDTFAALTYSITMTDRFSFGTSVKYVEENLAGLKMGGWMIDLGTFYWTGYKTLRFAVSLVNFGPDLKPNGDYQKKTKDGSYQTENYESFSPPTTFRVGSAMDVFSNQNYSLTSSVQINHPVDNAENAVLGFDFGYRKKLFLRGGYRINYDDERFTFGSGFRFQFGQRKLVLDYAFKDFMNLSTSHQFTLGFEF